MKPLNPTRILVYFLGFLLPPMFLGIVLTMGMVKDVMVQPEPEPMTQAAPLRKPGTLPYALIVVDPAGTQITDLLAATEILGRSGAYQVATVSTHQDLLPTTGPISLWPDFTFENAPRPEIIVVPALLKANDSLLLSWLDRASRQAKWILSCGEGAKALVEADLVSQKMITTHFIAYDSLKKEYPQIQWVKPTRILTSGNLISTSGLTATVDAALYVLEKSQSLELAQKTARSLHYAWRSPTTHPQSEENAKLSIQDLFHLLLRGGYAWGRQNLGVFVFDGMSEISLAATLDTFPRTLSARVVTMGKERNWIKTQNGLTLAPQIALPDAPKLDLILIPSGWESGETNPIQDSEVEKWVRLLSTHQRNFFQDPPGQAFDQMLTLLERWEGSSVTALVQKLIGAPEIRDPAGISWGLLFRPILIGILGLLLVYGFDRRFFLKPRK